MRSSINVKPQDKCLTRLNGPLREYVVFRGGDVGTTTPSLGFHGSLNRPRPSLRIIITKFPFWVAHLSHRFHSKLSLFEKKCTNKTRTRRRCGLIEL